MSMHRTLADGIGEATTLRVQLDEIQVETS
jgi:hypothetical protein